MDFASNIPAPKSIPDALTMLYPDLQASSSSASLAASSNSGQHDTPASTPPTPSENGDDTPPTGDTGPSTVERVLKRLTARAAHQAIQDLQAQQQQPPGACRKGDYILVTGGLGYIGSHTVLELMKEGYNVIIVDNLANSFASVRWRIQALAAQHCEARGLVTPTLAVHELDYQSPAMRLLLEQYCYPSEKDILATGILGADDAPSFLCDGGHRRSRISGIIHFAAFKSVEQSIGDPLSYYDNNVCGLVGFIRLLAEFNVRNFVFSSSATVYGSKANSGKPLDEDDLIHHSTTATTSSSSSSNSDSIEGSSAAITIEPTVEGLTCPYARTKYFCEAILADVARSDPRWRIVALRYFNPVGCDPSGLLGESPRTTPTNLFPILAQVLAGDRPALAVFGQDWPTRDGTAVRDYIHVADVARGHIAALDSCDKLASSSDAKDNGSNNNNNNNNRPFRTYNLGSGTGSSVLEIVDSVAAAASRPVPVQLTGRRPGDVGTCVASTARAEEELGWFPRESIAQSARDWWNYIRRRHNIQDTDKPHPPKISLTM